MGPKVEYYKLEIQKVMDSGVPLLNPGFWVLGIEPI